MQWRTMACGLAFAVLGATPLQAADTYVVDPGHSSIAFSVKHMVITNVKGSFADFAGTIAFDPEDPSASSVEVTIRTASITTNNEKRDADLRADGFLDVENHPTLTFKSTKIAKKGDKWVATGDLTLRGVTKQIELPFVVNGPIQNPWGQTVIGVQVDPVTINRQEYGVSWSKTMDNGGLVVADEVTIYIELEARKQ